MVVGSIPTGGFIHKSKGARSVFNSRAVCCGNVLKARWPLCVLHGLLGQLAQTQQIHVDLAHMRAPWRPRCSRARSGKCPAPALHFARFILDNNRGYGATVARLTPHQKVGSSNISGFIWPTSLLRMPSHSPPLPVPASCHLPHRCRRTQRRAHCTTIRNDSPPAWCTP